jgi:fucose permease
MTKGTQTATKYLMGTACAGVFTYGVLVSFLGATLPELRARLHFGMDESGTLFTILYLAQIPMVFIAGPLIDRFGKKPVLASGALVCAVSLLGIAYAPGFFFLGVLLFVLGLGGSFMNSGSNTLIPELFPENPSSALNLANIFFGLGAVFFPLLITLVATQLGLAFAMWMIAVIVGAVSVVVLAQRFPAARSASGFDWQEARSVALDPAVIILSWVLFFYVALEISAGGWIRTYLEQEFAVSARTSGLILTSFWATIMVGRLVASQLLKRVRGPVVLLAAGATSIFGLILMATAPSLALATLGIVICGLSFAPVFPTTVGTASAYFPKLFGTVFGILMATGLIGGMILPKAIGYVAERASVRQGIWLLVATAVLLLLVQGVFLRYEKRRFLTPKP